MMRRFQTLFAIALVMAASMSLGTKASLAAKAAPALIPMPAQVTMTNGTFTITPATKVLYSSGEARLANAAEYLAGRL